ncbi:MAG: hypothetical protein MJ131_00615 [Lachnospiraceae bacterium]|nr:hypothetical protein [Lachnospiraceae bacterium]
MQIFDYLAGKTAGINIVSVLAEGASDVTNSVNESAAAVTSAAVNEQGSVWSSVLVLAGCILVIVLLVVMWSQYMKAQKRPGGRVQKKDEKAFDSNGIVDKSAQKKNISGFANIAKKEK